MDSDNHRFVRLDMHDLQLKHRYGFLRAYGRSKLALLLFTYDLVRRLHGTGITVNALEPGPTATNFGQRDAGPAARTLLRFLSSRFGSPEQGAKTSLYLASSPEVETITRKYFVKSVPRRSSARSYNVARNGLASFVVDDVLQDPGVPVRMSAVTATIMGAHGADCLSAVLHGKTPRPLSFAYIGQGIALGRHNAIGFNNYPDDQPNPPYFTGWLGYLTADAPELAKVEERVDTEESISLAFLVLLEQLPPIERAVFLLREVFEYDYAEIATFLGKSEVACRQSFSRAKKHLADHRPRFQASADTQRQLLTGFLQAVEAGEMTPLMNLLAEDVTFWADGGGKVKGAATRPIAGRMAVARFILGALGVFMGSLPESSRVELAEVNRQPALIIRAGEKAFAVLTIEVEAQQIRTIRIVANPEKLAHV